MGALDDLTSQGVSIWLDDISRERLRSGNLQDLVDNKHVVGVTSNPTIFQKALERAMPTTTSSVTWPRDASRSTARSAISWPTTSAGHATC